MYHEEFQTIKRHYTFLNSTLRLQNIRNYNSYARYNNTTHLSTIHTQHLKDLSFNKIVKQIIESGFHEFLHHIENINNYKIRERFVQNIALGITDIILGVYD